MENLTKEELQEILEKHQKWLNDEELYFSDFYVEGN